MEHIKHELGNASAGDIAEVSLDHAANVILLDSSNYQRYRQGQQHTYYGGHISETPVRIAIPHSGHWYVAIDLGGYASNVRSSARLIRC